MNKKRLILTILLSALTVASVSADTLELANGSILEGDFVGSSNGIIMFNSGGTIEAFPQEDVVAIFFSAGIEAALAVAEVEAPPQITVPAGTRLVIRMADTIDSSRNGVGHRFRGQLEGALVVDGVTVAARNTFVHGRITSASQAGRLAGSSDLAIEFTDIMLNDQLFPISTGSLEAQSSGEAARTVGRTARAAALGGLIGGSSGARTGAAVGAGASILTSGSSINIPRGTMLETNLATPLTVPRP